MTAEIAILNKTAIALAADSAVTIGNQKGKKIYNTVNKLFALSKYQPVGIMVYGSAELMEIPWESIIKIYRDDFAYNKFDTLGEYANHFINFLNNNEQLFPALQQKKYFRGIIESYFNDIRDEIDEKVKTIIDKEREILSTKIKEIVEITIKNHFEEWESYDTLPSIPKSHKKNIIRKYLKIIEQVEKEIFQKLPLSIISSKLLKEICGNLFLKSRFPSNTSGIVIAGFGQKELFPSLKSYTIEARVNNYLKYKEENSVKISFTTSACILPFAQKEMVITFMEGIDPFNRRSLESYLSKLFEKYPENIIENTSKLSDKEKQDFLKKLKKIGKNIFNNFKNQMEEYINQNHVFPILDAVEGLPKDELAAMAESLVNLTSFKRKISMEAETVGGPIDVAVISKGDGFIWIKRKHYFKAELNPYFFANYYRKDSNIERRES